MAKDRRSAGHHPAAFCPEHGLFPMLGMTLEPGAQATIIGSQTNCPKCGRMSEIIPGVYHAGDSKLNILIDPSISPAALAALSEIAKAAIDGKISAADAKKKAEQIHPKAGKLFDVANWSDQAKATLYAAIIGASAVVGAAKLASSPSQTTIVQPVIERVIENSDRRAKIRLMSSSSLSNKTKISPPKPRPKSPKKGPR